jgi:hypothetical protein
MSGVTVYLDRDAIADVVLKLLVPPAPDRVGTSAEATASESNGEVINPADLQRVYREVERRLAEAREFERDEEEVLAELRELFGYEIDVDNDYASTLTAEDADPEADRDVAHRIITALATAFPLSSAQRDALPIAE